MKKISAIGIGILLILVIVGARIASIRSATKHLTETPPREIELRSGVNELTFPVVRGRYMLRIGISGMEPASFQFQVQGTLVTPSETVPINEVYEPTDAVLRKEVNGGYVVRRIDIEEEGTVRVNLDVSSTEDEALVLLFHGIK